MHSVSIFRPLNYKRPPFVNATLANKSVSQKRVNFRGIVILGATCHWITNTFFASCTLTTWFSGKIRTGFHFNTFHFTWPDLTWYAKHPSQTPPSSHPPPTPKNRDHESVYRAGFLSDSVIISGRHNKACHNVQTIQISGKDTLKSQIISLNPKE